MLILPGSSVNGAGPASTRSCLNGRLPPVQAAPPPPRVAAVFGKMVAWERRMTNGVACLALLATLVVTPAAAQSPDAVELEVRTIPPGSVAPVNARADDAGRK